MPLETLVNERRVARADVVLLLRELPAHPVLIVERVNTMQKRQHHIHAGADLAHSGPAQYPIPVEILFRRLQQHHHVCKAPLRPCRGKAVGEVPAPAHRQVNEFELRREDGDCFPSRRYRFQMSVDVAKIEWCFPAGVESAWNELPVQFYPVVSLRIEQRRAVNVLLVIDRRRREFFPQAAGLQQPFRCECVAIRQQHVNVAHDSQMRFGVIAVCIGDALERDCCNAVGLEKSKYVDDVAHQRRGQNPGGHAGGPQSLFGVAGRQTPGFLKRREQQRPQSHSNETVNRYLRKHNITLHRRIRRQRFEQFDQNTACVFRHVNTLRRTANPSTKPYHVNRLPAQ